MSALALAVLEELVRPAVATARTAVATLGLTVRPLVLPQSRPRVASALLPSLFLVMVAMLLLA